MEVRRWSEGHKPAQVWFYKQDPNQSNYTIMCSIKLKERGHYGGDWQKCIYISIALRGFQAILKRK